mgnify:FL=1
MPDLNRRSAIRTGIFGAVAATAAGTLSAKEAAPGSNEYKKLQFDLVVIGAGCAGMTAALEAADLGAKVALLEKMNMPFGNTIYAGGHFNATNTFVQKENGLTDTIDEFYKDMMTVSQGRGDPALTRIYCEKSADCIEWLSKRCGIKWKKMVKEVWPATVRGHVVDGPQKPGGAQLTSQMLAEVKKHPNITFMTNTKVIELKKSATLRCTGAIAVSKTEGALDIDSKCGVVVATGGFHANKEMICKYMGGGVARMPLRGSAFMMGENITLTKPFFPNLVNMDQFHGGPIGVNQANPSTMVNYGVIVNKSAQRIIDEEKTYVAVAKELPLLTKDNWAFIIIDSQVKDIDTVATRIARYEKAKAPIARGSTIVELARSMGVNEKTLEKTIADYNAAVKAGKADQLTPPNTLEKPRFIEKGPFMAFAFQGGMTATFGGPKIGKNGEVLNGENQPVPGLFACGNAIGGLFYYDYIVGSQLTAAVIWGLLSAKEAVKALKA